jgi:hypothetical protein
VERWLRSLAGILLMMETRRAGKTAAEEGFEFVELGEFLADGVGAFGVVGVVEFWKLEFRALIVHLSFSDSGKDFSKAENCGCG